MKDLLRRVFLEHIGLKLLSLGLALVLFLVVRSDKDAVGTGYVVVEYTYDKTQWVLMSNPPRQLRISVRGPWSRVNRFDDRKIPAIRINVGATKKEIISFRPGMIRVPKGLRVVAFSPPTAEIRVERLVEKNVPVTVRIVGEVARGYTLQGRATASPDSVLLRGPQSVLEKLAEGGLPLDPMDMTNAEGSVETVMSVVGSLPEHVTAITRMKVRVRQDVVALEGERTLRDVQVDTLFKDPNFTLTLDFPSVTVGLKGPKPVLDKIDPKKISVVIDLTKLPKRSIQHLAQLQQPVGRANVKNLPPQVVVLFVRPLRVPVRFRRKELSAPPSP